MILYEVNIKVNNGIFEKYYDWLNNHMLDMLKITGFKKASIFENVTNNHISNNANELTVVYEVNSKEDLENYFNNQAESMRSQAVELFGDYINISRRVLELKACYS